MQFMCRGKKGEKGKEEEEEEEEGAGRVISRS